MLWIEVFGPVSARHPDAYILNQSHIEEKLEHYLAEQQKKFKMEIYLISTMNF